MVREELDNQQFRRDFREISEQSHHTIPDIEYPFILGLQCLVILRNFNFHMTRHQTRNQKYDKKNIKEYKRDLLPRFRVPWGSYKDQTTTNIFMANLVSYVKRPPTLLYLDIRALMPCRAQLRAVICFDSCTKFMIFLFPNFCVESNCIKCFALDCIN